MAILLNSLAVLLVLCIIQKALTVDYCDKSLCKSGQHIACNNDGKFGKSCSADAEIIKIDDYLRHHILEKYNLLRQQIALDQKAVRMAKMVWDDELAKLAELNVKQCEAKRDECHNTKKFPDSGQNVGINTWSGKDTLDQDILAGFTQQWYNEGDDATADDIKSYNSAKWTNEHTIEHFALVMNEAATHVGCALLRQTANDGSINHFIACNYAANVVDGKPIYEVGVRPGRSCRDGRDEEFPYMCTSNEIYKRN